MRLGACSVIVAGAVRHRVSVSTLGAALTFAIVLIAAPPAALAQQLQPIPDVFVGDWSRHGVGLTISRFDSAAEQGEALARWRIYTWCQDPVTNAPNPPPCDSVIGNSLEDGGIAVIALTHP